MKQRFNGLLLLVAAGIWAACGDEGPEGSGRAQGVVHDPARASFMGELNGNVQVSISSDGSSWFDLGSLNGVTIMLQSNTDSTNVHGEQTVPADQYSRVRLTFQNVSAELLAGSTVGTTTLQSDVSIALGGSDHGVEVITQVGGFQVLADTTVRRSIILDLHSDQWITEAAVASQVVEDAAIQGAVTVTTRSEPRS
ncbi:MAG: hypothetical protein GTO22_27450 [Gemmatimonadales bacterium]|nr:hypothetical protein [Gemmatimonadales bacterium]